MGHKRNDDEEISVVDVDRAVSLCNQVNERDPIVVGGHFGHQVRQRRFLEPSRLDVGDCQGGDDGQESRGERNVDRLSRAVCLLGAVQESELDDEDEERERKILEKQR